MYYHKVIEILIAVQKGSTLEIVVYLPFSVTCAGSGYLMGKSIILPIKMTI